MIKGETFGKRAPGDGFTFTVSLGNMATVCMILTLRCYSFDVLSAELETVMRLEVAMPIVYPSAWTHGNDE